MPTPKVELNLGGTWTDATPDVRVAGGIQIVRGAADEQTTVAPGSLTFALDNADGKYSGRLPTSPYYGLLNRNTPVRVGVDPMSDTFTRSVTDGWGTSSSGHAWTIASGLGFDATAANFDVTGTAGTILAANANSRAALLPNSYGDVDVAVKLRFDVLTGSPAAGIITNWSDASNHFRINLNTNLAQLRVDKLAEGASIGLTGSSTSFSISAGVDYWIRASVGRRIRVKAWVDGDPEPAAWMLDFVDQDFSGVFPQILPRLGKVGLWTQGGTSVTVTFDDLTVDSYRFHGEVRSWPVKWDKAGVDVSTTIEATGILNRLGSSGQAQLQSAMFREATKDTVTSFIAAYWPCEDDEKATRFASAVPGTDALVMLDAGSFGQSSTIPGSRAMGVLGSNGSLHGWIPGTVDTTGKVYFRIVLDVPTSPTTPDNTNIMNLYCWGGTVHRVALIYRTTGDLTLQLIGFDGSVLATAGPHDNNIDGGRLYLSLEFVQNGSNVDWLKFVNRISDDNSSVSSGGNTGTFTSQTIGRCYRFSAGTMDGWGFCHIGVGNDQTFMFGMTEALIGNSGETAGDRAVRVAAEAGIALQVIGDPADTALMGPQVPGSGLDVLRSCSQADGGVLFESRNEFGLTFRTLASMYSQSGPVLDYDGGHINVIEPVEDDQTLANDVTVTRTAGSSARAVLESGALSVLEPPDGAGRIEAPALDVAVHSDLQLDNIAWWRLHILTWDEQRFRMLGVQHGAPALQADPDLWSQLAALDSGDQVCVDNPPAWLPPDRIKQLVRGYTEVIAEDGATSLWSLDWNATPANPYETGVWGSASDPNATDTEARYDSGYTQLSTDVDETGRTQGSDDFTRSVSGGWGTATLGGSWTDSGGLAADRNVNGSQGTISVNATLSQRSETILFKVDVDQTIHFSTDKLVTGGGRQELALEARRVDDNNVYLARAMFQLDQTVVLDIQKRVASVQSAVTSQLTVPGLTHVAGGFYGLRFQCVGDQLKAKVWRIVDGEPDDWQVSGTDSSLTAQNPVGVRVILGSGHTNLPVLFTVDNWDASVPELQVQITQGPVWTQDADDLPFDILVGGERMTVTAVANTTSPQVFTVTRAVNGVVKSHSSADPVELADPVFWAL